MNFNISSDAIGNPHFRPLLENLTDFFSSIQLRFIIIGAAARDLNLQVYGEKTGRATFDLDIAIAISDWKKFLSIEQGLLQIPGLKKDSKHKQRFIYKGCYFLDIVPFGEIMKRDGKIFWPPEEDISMLVLGYFEVDRTAIEVSIDNDLKINTATLSGVFLLKIIAWSERHDLTNKDADDIGFILRAYYGINENRILSIHNDLFDEKDFSTLCAGARLLGRDLSELLSENVYAKNKVVEILNAELDKQEESKLINQILDTNTLFYEGVFQSLKNITEELVP